MKNLAPDMYEKFQDVNVVTVGISCLGTIIKIASDQTYTFGNECEVPVEPYLKVYEDAIKCEQRELSRRSRPRAQRYINQEIKKTLGVIEAHNEAKAFSIPGVNMGDLIEMNWEPISETNGTKSLLHAAHVFIASNISNLKPAFAKIPVENKNHERIVKYILEHYVRSEPHIMPELYSEEYQQTLLDLITSYDKRKRVKQVTTSFLIDPREMDIALKFFMYN